MISCLFKWYLKLFLIRPKHPKSQIWIKTTRNKFSVKKENLLIEKLKNNFFKEHDDCHDKEGLTIAG